MLCSSSSIDRDIVVKLTVDPLGLTALVESSFAIRSVSSGRGSSESGV